MRERAADAGRDGRTCFTRTRSPARTGSGKIIFSFQLTTSRIGNHITLLYMVR